MSRFSWCLLLCVGLGGVVPAAEPVLPDGTFERSAEGWTWWSRQPAISGTVTAAAVHDGAAGLRLVHTGERDWSFAPAAAVPVRPGERYELTAWVRVAGGGNAGLSFVRRSAPEQVQDWLANPSRPARQRPGTEARWLALTARITVPAGTNLLTPRLVGEGAATIDVDGFRLRQLADRPAPAGSVTAQSTALVVGVRLGDGGLDIEDRRSHRRWTTTAGDGQVEILAATAVPGGIDLRGETLMGQSLTAAVRLDPRLPEAVITVHLDATSDDDGPLPTLAWPPPLVTAPGDQLIVPLNEGIAYPVDDPAVEPARLVLYGGHGICMPWWGQVDGDGSNRSSVAGQRTGLMTLVETPDDASVDLKRDGGRLVAAPLWDPQLGRWGQDRRLRLVAIDQGGYVAMAKRYRQHATDTGLLRTLTEKRKAVPAIDRLVGAVNVWCWDSGAAALCRELKAAGIGRILWSNQAAKTEVEAMNALGVLTSRYDIYQDLMDPARFGELEYTQLDWTTEGWPKDLMRGADGDWLKGWEIERKASAGGGMVPCGVLCDAVAPAYARKRITEELTRIPYQSRFLDTTTASPWRECYDPAHPLTRSQSRAAKMELLAVVSRESHLVCGSETGHDASVPFVDYFEGMLSLGPYRVPDSGRNMERIVTEVPEPLARFQTGHQYRLPLWELVYHDCVVAQWYWGDHSAKLPALWDRRDAWNALYGTPPMFMFDRARWQRDQARFVRSYRTATPVARATGYAEMTDHRWLTADHGVQATRFANGVQVTVNFGDRPWTAPDGTTIPPLGITVRGLPTDLAQEFAAR